MKEQMETRGRADFRNNIIRTHQHRHREEDSQVATVPATVPVTVTATAIEMVTTTTTAIEMVTTATAIYMIIIPPIVALLNDPPRQNLGMQSMSPWTN